MPSRVGGTGEPPRPRVRCLAHRGARQASSSMQTAPQQAFLLRQLKDEEFERSFAEVRALQRRPLDRAAPRDAPLTARHSDSTHAPKSCLEAESLPCWSRRCAASRFAGRPSPLALPQLRLASRLLYEAPSWRIGGQVSDCARVPRIVALSEAPIQTFGEEYCDLAPVALAGAPPRLALAPGWRRCARPSARASRLMALPRPSRPAPLLPKPRTQRPSLPPSLCARGRPPSGRPPRCRALH